MNTLAKKPYLFFFGFALISLILGYFFKNESYDINYYGILISITYFDFFLISSIFFCLIGLNYYSLIWTKRPPKKWLTIIHLFLQTIAFFLFIYIIFKIDTTKGIDTKNEMIFQIFGVFFIFLVSLVIHLINFFSSLVSAKKQQ